MLKRDIMIGKSCLGLFFCFVAICFGSCAKEAVAPPKQTIIIGDTIPMAAIIDTVAENHIDREFLLRLVNGLRAHGCSCGGVQMPPVSALTWNGLLERAAWGHSLDMQVNHYFNHNSPSGSTPQSRITAAGYNWVFSGENLAMGHMDEQAVVVGWLGSAHHCQNMMSPDYTNIGIARDGDYWTMDLGTPGTGTK